MNVAAILDRAQHHLRDAESIGSDGLVWTRSELLSWLQDGYRLLLARTRQARQFTILDVPPRFSFAYTFPWERQHLQGGSGRQWTYPSHGSQRQTTTLWETEQRAGLTPLAGFTTVTHLWELAYTSTQVDHHYRFALPEAHDQLLSVWHDHERLVPTTMRQLDRLDTAWYRVEGEPLRWTPGLDQVGTFEVYEIETEYQQSWEQRNGFYGVPRAPSGENTYTVSHQAGLSSWAYAYATDGEVADGLSGVGYRFTQTAVDGYQGTQAWELDMLNSETTLTGGSIIGTYPWEADHGATNVGSLPVGLLRSASSADRQYLAQPSWSAPLGTLRRIRSSEENLLVYHAVTPSPPDLEDTHTCTPEILPAPLHKYLTYYVLSFAFNRQGEGYNPNLALHWQQRFERGVRFLRKLGELAYRDVQFKRQPVGRRPGRIPQPQLPSDYPAVPWLR